MARTAIQGGILGIVGIKSGGANSSEEQTTVTQRNRQIKFKE